MKRETAAWTVGGVVAVVSLSFNLFQYVERKAEERGAERALIKQLEQLVGDVRARVMDLERLTIYLHGEQRPKS
mgnify:CR=1 FL=1